MEKKEVVSLLIQEIVSNDSQANIYTERLQGYQSSQEINSFKPDIEVFSKETHNLIEVQLSSNFDLPKWKSFSEFSKMDASKEFHIVVPKDLKNDVKDVIVENNIDAQLLYF